MSSSELSGTTASKIFQSDTDSIHIWRLLIISLTSAPTTTFLKENISDKIQRNYFFILNLGQC